MAKYTKKNKRRIKKYYAQIRGSNLSKNTMFYLGYLSGLVVNNLIEKKEMTAIMEKLGEKDPNVHPEIALLCRDIDNEDNEEHEEDQDEDDDLNDDGED